MRHIFRWRSLLILIGLLILLALPFGPLFPWSPIHPGYKEQRFTRATVLYPSDVELPDAYRHIDEYIERAERFHRLPAKSRVTVIICRNTNDVVRFLPAPNATRAGGLTNPTGTVILITPKITQQRAAFTGEFLHHELSHALLSQNQRPWNSVRMSRQQWFAEGLAVSFAEQKAFAKPEDVLTYAQTRDLTPIIDPDQIGTAKQPLNMVLAYQVWRYFLEHLIETRGREAFQRFMTEYMAGPADYRELFIRVYGVSLPQAIQQFQNDLRAGRWTPHANFVTTQL